MRFVLVILLSAAVGLLALPQGSIAFPLNQAILEADFDDRVPGDPIGTGGAAAGEPLTLGSLSTLVLDLGGGDLALRVDNDLSSTSARRLRWGFLDDQEVTEGTLVIRFTMRPSALDRYSLLIREALGSSRNFMSMSFSETGVISISDAAGVALVASGAYSAQTEHAVELRFDMDLGTYEFALDGSTLLEERSHGIGDRGIGSVLIGYQANSAGSDFVLDDLRVLAPLPPSALDVVLEADFDDKPLGQAIGSGGARVGEPVGVDSTLITEVIAATSGGRALELRAASQPFPQSLRWQLLDQIEIGSGLVLFQFELRSSTLDDAALLFRESGGATRNFLDLRLRANGDITASADNVSLGVIATYAPGDIQAYEVLFNMDADTVSIARDGAVLLDEHAFGSGDRGIGSFVIGFDSAASAGGSLTLDSILVRASDVRDIPAALAFLQQPLNAMAGSALAPAVEVGVVNVFNQPVPDATQVTLGRASGNAGVTLTGNTSHTEGGAARFDALSLDTPGTYTLSASSALASTESTAFVVSAGVPANAVFLVQPGSAIVNAVLAPTVRVRVNDAAGNAVADGTQVQLAIASGPSGALLSGATSTTSGGVTEFPGLSLNLAGSYVLQANAGSASATSTTFAVTPPPSVEIFNNGFEPTTSR